MKIRFLTSASGVDWTANTKEPIDLPAEEAKRYVESGQAVYVEGTSRKATNEKREKATQRKPKGA